MTDQRHIEYLPLESLVPAERNPKRHKITEIVRSIDRFGFTTPAVLDERTGRLVVGHGRVDALTAMRDSGQAPPEGILLGADDQWLAPVITGWSSRSDAEASAYLVADNRYTELGGWDALQLDALLGEIGDVDQGLVAVVGFDDADLAELLAGGDIEELPDVGPTEPRSSVRAENQFTATGDVWIIGRHRITCGDLRDYDTVEHLESDGIRADVLFAILPAEIRNVSIKSTRDANREFAAWFSDVQTNAKLLLGDTGWLVTVDPASESVVVLLVAQDDGGTVYGADPDPGRIDLVCRRIQLHTGIVPILESTGQEHDFLAA